MFKIFKKKNKKVEYSEEVLEIQRNMNKILEEHQENIEDILGMIKNQREAIDELRNNFETLQKLVSKNEGLD